LLSEFEFCVIYIKAKKPKLVKERNLFKDKSKQMKLKAEGLGSDSQLFEPRLATLRLRLGVLEPMDNIKY
jgi:hypothetical protein